MLDGKVTGAGSPDIECLDRGLRFICSRNSQGVCKESVVQGVVAPYVEYYVGRW